MPITWNGIRYTLVESHNVDNYMKELGVGFVGRFLQRHFPPSIVVKQEGDEYSMTTHSIFGVDVKRFKPGVPFDEKIFNGSVVKSIITIDGNKFIHKLNSNPPQLIVNEFGEKGMTATMKLNDVTSVRKYVAEEPK